MAAKITPVVPTPRRYGGRRTLQVILSGVSQETDVTNVAKVAWRTGSALSKVLPSSHQALWDLFGIQRKDQVIAPVAIDVQIARP